MTTSTDGAPHTPLESILSRGLTAELAAHRLKVDGYNELPSPDRRGFLRIVWEVIRQPMFALLIGGGIVYLLLGDRLEALLLLAFATLSVLITIVQESRSERVLEALRNLASPRALVIRDGKRTLIAGREVVTNDLIVISEGDRVAADAQLLTAQDLLLDESLLTGESVPVRKSAVHTIVGDGSRNAVPGGDDLPFVFAGTLVVRGSGVATVTATALRTEMGKIGAALGGIETTQPHLQRQIRWFVRDFALVGAVAGLLTVVLFGLLRGSWLEALLGGIAIGMSLLPEEFPLVMTVFMAMGARRISRARVLTRRASAIETLGSTTVLCTDKTGTLTENRMTVVAIISPESRWDRQVNSELRTDIRRTLEAALFACPELPVDPMDVAIHALANPPGSEAAPNHTASLLRAYGLRPDLFVVANVWADERGGVGGYAKGALEAITEICRLSDEQTALIRAEGDSLARVGVRVLGVARTGNLTSAQAADLPDSPRGLPFEYMGLIGLADPLRDNVPAAVVECRSAGIRVLMITGDYAVTAGAIGQQAGLASSSGVLTGDEIERLSDDELAARMRTTDIFARIRPSQKLRLVETLKRNGEVVAMTGDGVNDAPAIKAAHIGIAMGGRGTEVAREAASIVLLDDDFSSIVTTIRLGRRIYDNLRKAIEYIVAVHIPIAGLALLPLILGLPLMLTPIHIAFLEMIIDPACSMVFEAEGEERDVMRRPPRNPKTPLLLRKRLIWALFQGVVVLAVLAALLIIGAHLRMAEADLRALIFTSLVLMNMGLILLNRSFGATLTDTLLRPNRSLWLLLGGVTLLLASTLTWAPARSLFHFGQLHWDDLAICAAVGVISLVGLERLKARWMGLPG
jgi:Ca2+-transporting ATPase